MNELAYEEKNDCAEKIEKINGKIVMMSPRPRIEHNTVITNIVSEFRHYLRGKFCRAYGDGTDVYLDEENHFIPDAMIVCDQNIIKHDGIHGAPSLVVEVLSPSTAKNDRWYKKFAYEKAGVKEYWIVDPLNYTIEVYINKDGGFISDGVYTKADTKIKVSLFDDLYVELKYVFDYDLSH